MSYSLLLPTGNKPGLGSSIQSLSLVHVAGRAMTLLTTIPLLPVTDCDISPGPSSTGLFLSFPFGSPMMLSFHGRRFAKQLEYLQREEHCLCEDLGLGLLVSTLPRQEPFLTTLSG